MAGWKTPEHGMMHAGLELDRFLSPIVPGTFDHAQRLRSAGRHLQLGSGVHKRNQDGKLRIKHSTQKKGAAQYFSKLVYNQVKYGLWMSTAKIYRNGK